MKYALMTTLETGDTLDHYRLDATVAHSGMSTLFKATDLRDGRQVAIKVPHAEMEADWSWWNDSSGSRRLVRSWITLGW
jgi:hypothetical protein